MEQSSAVRFIAPSWDEILERSIKLAEKIRRAEKEQFDGIVGISRGGLALTRIMSDLLDTQNVMITRCEYYTDIGEKRKKPIITQKIQGNISGKKILVVDDVADSGESLVVIKDYLESKRPADLKISTIFIKPWCKMLPDYFVARTDAWIIFPWEYYEAIKSLSATNSKDILSNTHIPPKYIDMLYRMDKSLRMRWKKTSG